MASNANLASNTASAMLNAFTALASGGYLNVYNGTQPGTADTSITSQTQLAQFGFASTSFGNPSNGVVSVNNINTAIASAAGTATWFRIFGPGNNGIMDGSVGVTGADLNLATTSINQGDLIGVTSFTISLPLR